MDLSDLGDSGTALMCRGGGDVLELLDVLVMSWSSLELLDVLEPQHQVDLSESQMLIFHQVGSVQGLAGAISHLHIQRSELNERFVCEVLSLC